MSKTKKWCNNVSNFLVKKKYVENRLITTPNIYRQLCVQIFTWKNSFNEEDKKSRINFFFTSQQINWKSTMIKKIKTKNSNLRIIQSSLSKTQNFLKTFICHVISSTFLGLLKALFICWSLWVYIIKISLKLLEFDWKNIIKFNWEKKNSI